MKTVVSWLLKNAECLCFFQSALSKCGEEENTNHSQIQTFIFCFIFLLLLLTCGFPIKLGSSKFTHVALSERAISKTQNHTNKMSVSFQSCSCLCFDSQIKLWPALLMWLSVRLNLKAIVWAQAFICISCACTCTRVPWLQLICVSLAV